ncbi:hypothetical protein L5G32_11505 [Gordonia sp. HY002]|uniref:hypothetical protein n=2 Tax=Gordonia zhenghanii TaxID=2911516 RepID=UPI001F434C26|nr:hypothetical protein [Gordonia zhenghanii]MCF8570891.1 hypothetical protein [Gordonia zhenghanii]
MTGSATLQDNEFEDCIRNRYTDAELVVETDPTVDEISRVHSQLGRLMSQMPAGAHFALITGYPALIATALVGHAALRDGATDFWDGFADAIGVDRDPSFEAALVGFAGDMFRTIGLRDVEALRDRDPVWLLELHAGIPAHAIGGLVDVIEQHVTAGRAPQGTVVLDHLTEPGFSHRRRQLPAEFRALLDHAPDIAVTFLARICAVLVASIAEPATWSADALTESAVDLPPTILSALRDRLADKPFLDGDDDAAALCIARFPELRYDAAEGTLDVVIPSDEKPTTWRAWAGDAPEQVQTGADEAAVVPVTSALRECVLVNLDTGARRAIPVVLPGDPIVLFAPDGRVMSRHRTLPAGEVLALVPKDAEFTGSGRKKVAVTDTRNGPWDGWLLRTLDLAGHRELTVVRDGRAGTTRRVRPAESPSIELPEPLPGITTRDGDPVFGERPLVDLPAHHGDGDKRWRVRVRRVGDLDWLVDYPWESEAFVTSADPFDGVDAPLVGAYEIVVSDSYALDLRRVAVIVEGLGATHDPAVRLPAADGLAESVTELTADGDLAVDDAKLTFGPSDVEQITSTRSGDASLELVVRPPHALVRLERAGVPSAWQTALPVIDVDATDHRRLAVYVPGGVDVSFALLDGDFEIVREWESEGRAGTEFALATRPLADAARRLVSGTIVAVIEDADGETDEAPIAMLTRGVEQPNTAVSASAPAVDDLTGAWMLLDTAQAADAESPAPSVDVLTADATASLVALGDSPVAPRRIPALLIRSGLAERPFAPSDRASTSHPNPYVGCTIAMSAIVDPKTSDRDEIQSYLTTRGGDELLRLLATGRMSDPRTGVFDRNVMAVESMGRDQVDMLFEHFRLVPGPVLDLDMRTSATIDAFHHRMEWMADPLSVEAPRHVNTMLRDVRRSSPEMYDLISARNEVLAGVDTGTSPWMLLSMQSMTFAAVARLQANDCLKKGGLTDEGRAMWAALADYFPGMVSADLLMANAVAVRAAALAAVRQK